MGGAPKPGTKPDKRLKANKPKATKKSAPKKGVNPFAKKAGK